MTAARIQIVDPAGVVQVDDAMRSVPAGRSAEDAARRIADDLGPGWLVRMWLDVPLVGSLASLGEPNAAVTGQAVVWAQLDSHTGE